MPGRPGWRRARLRGPRAGTCRGVGTWLAPWGGSLHVAAPQVLVAPLLILPAAAELAPKPAQQARPLLGQLVVAEVEQLEPADVGTPRQEARPSVADAAVAE